MKVVLCDCCENFLKGYPGMHSLLCLRGIDLKKDYPVFKCNKFILNRSRGHDINRNTENKS